MKKFLALLILPTLFLAACGERDTKYDAFASCLAETNTKYYGAFWCPNCQEQSKLFGDSKDLVPYIECAQGGKDAQVQLCLNEGIQSYPTWRFANGKELVGLQSLETIADYSGCSLDEEDTVDSVMFESTEE